MTDQDFDYICRLVRERCALVLEPGKEYLVQARLTPVLKQLQLGSITDLVAKLRLNYDDAIKTRVVEAMVTTETLFFRDHHPFETLRTTVIPELINKRESERRVEIWCAACSTGQEPYSLAILLREHFPQLANWQVKILATDISGDVLNRAKAGVYSQIEVNRGLPAPLLIKYFRQDGANWQLREDIRKAVEFREMNLIKPWLALPRMDLIFIRNVLIYFDVETKKTILGRCAKVLRSDGYLMMGGAETTMNLDDSYSRVASLKGGFFKLNS